MSSCDDVTGAMLDEVGIMNGLTVNLHLLMVNNCAMLCQLFLKKKQHFTSKL